MATALVWLAIGATFLFCYGCATGGSLTPVSPGQGQAEWIVWHVYNRTDTPPLVRWMSGDQLTCVDPASNKPGFVILDPSIDDPTSSGPALTACREGMTWSPTEVFVAWHGELSFSETALAHEMRHAAMLRDGILDPAHVRDDWKPLEDCKPDSAPTCGIVAKANAALLEAGR